QLAGRHQVALAALQRREELVLRLGDELQADFTPVAGVAVEVLLEGADAVIFHAHLFALDLPRAVAALVHQHLEHAAATYLRQVTGFDRLLPDFRRPRQTRAGRGGQQRQQAEQDQQRSRHRISRDRARRQRAGASRAAPRIPGWRARGAESVTASRQSASQSLALTSRSAAKFL